MTLLMIKVMLCGDDDDDQIVLCSLLDTFVDVIASRASVKLFELGVRTPGGLLLGVWYAKRSNLGIISDLLETTKPASKYARVFFE